MKSPMIRFLRLRTPAHGIFMADTGGRYATKNSFEIGATVQVILDNGFQAKF
jgi:hypothetical protein